MMFAWASPLLLAAALVAPAACQSQNGTGKVPLRIMPLGASVTFGTGSSTGNSYRKDLLDLLTKAGFEVNMVGLQRNGNFTNNQVEATGGFIISQIATAAKAAVPRLLPNLVLVDAGTNNCNQGGTDPQAGQLVTDMINGMYNQSRGATVILTTILQNKIAEQDACRQDINKQYQALASQFTQKGAKFLLVDMRNGGPTVNDLADTRHPNDAGYQKMANVWMQGIQEVVTKNFVVAPISNGTVQGQDVNPSGSAPAGAQSTVQAATGLALAPPLAGVVLGLLGVFGTFLVLA